MRWRRSSTGIRVGALAAPDPRARAPFDSRPQVPQQPAHRAQGTGTAASTCWPISLALRKRASSRGASRWPTTAGSTACTSSGSTPVVPVHESPRLGRTQQRDHGTRRQSGFEFGGLPRVAGHGLHVVEQRVGRVHLRHGALQAQQLLRRDRRREFGEQVAPIATEQQLPLERRRRVAEFDAHQEAVELRLRQRVRADLVRRVLRRDDEERFGQRIGLAVGRDLVLFHGLEQRALRLGRRAVHFVGEHELREDRPAMEAELARVGFEHRHADDVGRQQVARELDALVREPERAGEGVGQRGLADARGCPRSAGGRARTGTRGTGEPAFPCRG